MWCSLSSIGISDPHPSMFNAGAQGAQPRHFYVDQLAIMKERELNTLYVDFEHLRSYDEVSYLSPLLLHPQIINSPKLFKSLFTFNSLLSPCSISLMTSQTHTTAWSLISAALFVILSVSISTPMPSAVMMEVTKSFGFLSTTSIITIVCVLSALTRLAPCLNLWEQ